MGKFKNFFKTKGILLAAGLCVVAAGVAGVSVINRMIDSLGGTGTSEQQSNSTQEDEAWQTDDIEQTPVGKTETDVPKSPSASSSQGSSVGSSSDSGSVAGQPSALEGTSSPRCVRPVQGEVTAQFSGDELIYNETMDDWRTHNGTDFAAAYGETVCSITTGTVKTVEEDPLWGWTVEVEGTDGLLRYTGLAQKPNVKQGDSVAAGDTLGKLDELDAEIALEPHLHVEYEKDGKLQNVMDLLAG